MKDDIRQRLMEAVKRDADRRNKAEDEQRQKEKAKERFEVQWDACVQTTILPAIQPVKDILVQHGWSVTSTRDSKVSLTIATYKSDDFSMRASARPHLQFSCDSGARCVRLYAGRSSGIGEPIQLGDLSGEFVQERIVRFVEALTVS
jgi:hypothetical protein